jgi:hypothetical protein
LKAVRVHAKIVTSGVGQAGLVRTMDATSMSKNTGSQRLNPMAPSLG